MEHLQNQTSHAMLACALQCRVHMWRSEARHAGTWGGLMVQRLLNACTGGAAQVTDLASSSERLHREHVVMIKSQMEVEEENIVNRLQRQIETLLASYKALEAALEARGINIKDLTGPLVVDRATEWVYGRSPSKTSSDLRRSSEFASAHPLRVHLQSHC